MSNAEVGKKCGFARYVSLKPFYAGFVSHATGAPFNSEYGKDNTFAQIQYERGRMFSVTCGQYLSFAQVKKATARAVRLFQDGWRMGDYLFDVAKKE